MQTRPQENVDVRRYFEIIYRRKWMIAALVVATLAVTVVITYLMRPVYQSRVKLLVSGKVTYGRTFTQMDVPMYQDVAAYKKKEITKTQSEIALSWDNLLETVKRLKLWEVERPKHKLRERFYLFMDKVMRAVYRAIFEVKRIFLKIFFGTEIEWVEGTPDPVVEATKQLRRSVGTEWVQDSDIFTLSVQHWNPQWAKRIVNTLAEVYLESRERQLAAKAEMSYAPFVDELDDVEQQLRSIEARIEAFKKRRGIAKLDTELESNIHHLATLQVSYFDLLRSYQFKLAEMAAERAEIEEKYGPKHPNSLAIQSKMEGMRRRIQLASVLEEKGWQGSRDLGPEDRKLLEELWPIIRRIAELEDEIADLSANEMEMVTLYRELEATSEIYKLLKKKKEEAYIADADEFQEVYLLEKGRAAAQPISPRKDVNYGTGLVTSLIIGIFLAFFLDYVKVRIERPEEVERELELEVVAEIPRR